MKSTAMIQWDKLIQIIWNEEAHAYKSRDKRQIVNIQKEIWRRSIKHGSGSLLLRSQVFGFLISGGMDEHHFFAIAKIKY